MQYEQIKEVYFGRTIKEKRQEIVDNLQEGNVIKLNVVPFVNRTAAKKLKAGWFAYLTREKISPQYSPIITENNTAHNKEVVMYDVHLVHWDKTEQMKKKEMNKKFLRGRTKKTI